MKINDITNTITDFGINANGNDVDRALTRLLNKFQLLIFVVFFIHSLTIFISFGLIDHSVFLGCISILVVATMFLREKRKNSWVIASVFLSLCALITYYSFLCGSSSGVFLLFFPMLFAVVFVEDIIKPRFITVFITIVIISCMFRSSIVSNQAPFINEGYHKKLMFLNITFSILTFILVYYLIKEKKKSLFEFEFRLKQKQLSLKIIKSENEELLKSIDFKGVSEIEIIKMAEENNPLFLDKFSLLYPELFNKLQALSSSNLILSDLHLCALMRLSFDTKKIARYTNTSIKSVDSKKYRLRKKLNIPSDVETIYFIKNI